MLHFQGLFIIIHDSIRDSEAAGIYFEVLHSADFVEVITPLLRSPLMAVLIQHSRVFRGSVNTSDVPVY